MAASPLHVALDAILRPLDFAARDDFAHFSRVKGLEKTLRQACARALELAIPRDLQATLDEIARELDGVEGDATPVLRRIRERLEPFRESFCERALARSTEALPGVGPKRAETLAARGLVTVSDLLFHLPLRYDDRRSLVEIGDLEVGRRATFLAEVRSTDFGTMRSRGRWKRIFQAAVSDETGTIKLKWFRGGEMVARNVKKGARVLITGDVKRYRFSKELVHPEVELVDEESAEDPTAGREVVPDYPAPDGVNQRTLRRLVRAAVDEYADLLSGWLPARLAHERGLPEPAQALRAVHAPPPDADVDEFRERASSAHLRLVLEELYLLELGLALRRSQHARLAGIAVDVESERVRRAPDELPFRLTMAQQRAWAEIRADLARPHPMARLLQGDVGSGKTAVAFLAAVAVAADGGQAALMAPTELLAEQHARTLAGLVEAAEPPVRLALLTSSLARPAADEVRRALAAGEIDCVVGTHALFQHDVHFARLVLAVTDEQHRFGVLQRAALGQKGPQGLVPHSLVMTATPIPRTLALTLYGDLDLSVIDELPPGRKPVDTILLRQGEGRRVTDLVRATVDRGEQVYVVYPLVEESEKVDLRSATQSAERIQAAFRDVRVDLVHGRLDAAARGETMARFERGETQILVSTTVIEVGVDIPAATLMVVEHAERFGLAQLHQLRGRVGRGDRPGTCILVARGVTTHGEARLQAMLETQDGFAIADADLRIRGPGEFLGTRQHGVLPDLRLADLLRDARLVSLAREAALEQVRGDPGLSREPALRSAVTARWGGRLALANVG